MYPRARRSYYNVFIYEGRRRGTGPTRRRGLYHTHTRWTCAPRPPPLHRAAHTDRRRRGRRTGFRVFDFPKKKKGGVGVVFTSRVRSLEHNATVKLCGTTPRTSHVRNNTRERVENPTKELRAEPPGDDGVLIFFNSAELTTCSTVETRRT